ncbi:Uncharacterised protein [Segatella copri]|nr:Uncharacterised protein [Segatella copri]
MGLKLQNEYLNSWLKHVFRILLQSYRFPFKYTPTECYQHFARRIINISICNKYFILGNIWPFLQ